MAWRLCNNLETSCSCKSFYCGVDVWIRRPNVINRKLVGAVILLETSLSVSSSRLDSSDLSHVTVGELQSAAAAEEPVQGQTCEGKGSKILVRKLIPRTCHVHSSFELVVIELRKHTVSFFQLTFPNKAKTEIAEASVCKEIAYRFMYSSNGGSAKISLFLTEQYSSSDSTLSKNSAGIASPTTKWLGGVLLPKVVQWSHESAADGGTCEVHGKGQSLVPLDRYSCLYQQMKEKYGHTLIKNWPESTDPFKFVYEDIAIATYLLVLWEEERREKNLEQRQSFVDLGCGNGLLVYLLTSEGHPGKGLDLRERKIWKMFREKATLEVSALTPSATTLFPEFDWLIGNHSDELTPWLPVMAARSSHSTCFFVLPCCAHDFNKKFHRDGSGKSQYRFYLDYVREIGEKMGFKVQEDVLRIPSSKRVCLIGEQRTYAPCEEATVDALRQQFLDERCGLGRDGGCGFRVVEASSSEKWGSGFVPRGCIEPVKNCSQVDQSVSQLIVSTIASALLQTEHLVSIERASDGAVDAGGGSPCQLGEDASQWNVGGSISVREAAGMFDKNVLCQLKKECGGLQTLLRNWHQVFEVFGGFIHLRNWALLKQPPTNRRKLKACSAPQQEAKKLLLKTKLCWFHEHHPQGCPRISCHCPYAHGQTELKNRPKF